MHEILLLAGIALIFAGFIAMFAYVLLNVAQQGKSPSTGNASNASIGGVVMIGPIPIVFGNSPRMVVVAEVLAIVLIVIAAIVFFLLARR
ncbi:MAG: TIGR00304 family membrane protein [Candidatus Micrarchaeia archaeon]